MTSFEPANDQQRALIESEAPLTVVLGGPGTGKTTCACAAARRHLERTGTRPGTRVLFLSFSRASVNRITQRSREVLGPVADKVDITTFHSLAWSIVRRFGSMVGIPDPRIGSMAFHRVHSGTEILQYDDLIPTALEIIEANQAVRNHLRQRWGLVIIDEYQDTGDLQAQLVESISAEARVIILGDGHQCIYGFLKSQGVDPQRLPRVATEAGPENTVVLPPVSLRDPSGVIPAAAEAIRIREFGSPAIQRALAESRLEVIKGVSADEEGAVVARQVQLLRSQGHNVGVFCHHNDALATLSDELLAHDVDHDIAGLSEALSSALLSQVSMLKFACSAGGWDEVLDGLAVFVTSAVRGNKVPPLAHRLQSGGTGQLSGRLARLRESLTDAPLSDAMSHAGEAHADLGLTGKASAWKQATTLLRPMVARASRAHRRAEERVIVMATAREAEVAAAGHLIDDLDQPGAVTLMNLHQTKGREADATIVVLRATDNFGKYELAPYSETGRLLYVVFSRARLKVTVILIGKGLPAQIAPLSTL